MDLHESVAGMLLRDMKDTAPAGAAASSETGTDLAGSGGDTAERLIFYEHIFFILDRNRSLSVEKEECEWFLSFAALHINPDERDSIMSKHDAVKDGMLNRMEFCALCRDVLHGTPKAQIEAGLTNMLLAWDQNKERNKAYWNDLANRLDSYSRLAIPALYILCLLLLFSADFSDDYATSGTAVMFEGLGNLRFSAVGLAGTAVYTVIGMIVVAVGMLATKKAAKKKQEVQERVKKAMRLQVEDEVKRRFSTSGRDPDHKLEG